MSYCFFLFTVITLLGCKHPEGSHDKAFRESSMTAAQEAKADVYKVVGIKDGDTIVVLMDGKEQVIRLAHIDCPEKKQPFGTKAKQFASDLCFGHYVSLSHNRTFDRNKRLIAEIILTDGTNVNKELVKNGLAWHFKKYSDDNAYHELEQIARSEKVGIWSEPNPIAPWDWRK